MQDIPRTEGNNALGWTWANGVGQVLRGAEQLQVSLKSTGAADIQHLRITIIYITVVSKSPTAIKAPLC